MRKQECLDYSRRALLGASGALALLALLQPLRIFAQAGGGKVRIGIIGSGHIGGAIGGLWVKAGHPVLFSSRHPEELKDLVAGLGPLAQNGTVSQAVAFGDALFFAVPYGALPQLGRDYGDALQGKVVLDACNAVPARDGVIAEEVEREGIGITSQKYLLSGTRLVRAFNTLSYTIFVREANRPDPKLAIPIAADDGEALKKIAKLTPSFLAGTRGAQGTIWLDEHQNLQQTPAFPVHTVDTLGAGDVFHGAFALAITENQDVPSALRFASAAAALKCTRFGGAFAAPQRAEVSELLSHSQAAGPPSINR